MLIFGTGASAGEKSILGWVEYVDLAEHDFVAKAKLDTGAKTSSMHAKDIEIFTRNDKPWVRFSFQTKDYSKGRDNAQIRRITLERPRVRNIVIKRHKSRYQERPVIEMTLCINGEMHNEQFSLIDRSRFLYPILLGRRALRDIAVVDSGETFLGSAKCKDQSDSGED